MEDKIFWDYYKSKILPTYFYRDGTDIQLIEIIEILANKTDFKSRLWCIYYQTKMNYYRLENDIIMLQNEVGDTYMPFLFVLARYYLYKHQWQKAIDISHKIIFLIDQLSKEDPDFFLTYKILVRTYTNIGNYKEAFKYNCAYAQVCHMVTGNDFSGIDLLNKSMEKYLDIYNKNPEFYNKYCPFIKNISDLVTQNKALKKENVELASAPGGKAHLAAKEEFEKLNAINTE